VKILYAFRANVGSVVEFVPSSFMEPKINLAFQFAILAVLFASLAFRKRRNFFLHGVMMMVAVALNAFSFLLTMGPSFFGLAPFIIAQTLDMISVLTMIHGSFGAVAEILGLWIVASWRLRSSIQKCVRKKRIMQVTLAVWLIALFLGILLYMRLYP